MNCEDILKNILLYIKLNAEKSDNYNSHTWEHGMGYRKALSDIGEIIGKGLRESKEGGDE